MDLKVVDGGWGSFLKFKLLTDIRPFEQVESALHASNIQDHHANKLLERPKPATAFTRSMGYLARTSAASIPFPKGSPNAQWEENGHTVVAERNPNYSLKVESVKGMPKDEIAYRINISDRRSRNENMAHVLTATYRPNLPVEIMPGDMGAYDKFGDDIRQLVKEAYEKFFNNYDDTDIRSVVDKELASLKAVHVLGHTTNFIARDSEASPFNTLRAQKLVEFIHACGHLANILGLDGTERTRDAIVDELKSSILAEMEEYEADLDDKLNAKTKERQRGTKQRERMKATAEQNIDKIMALAEYHATVLGVMVDGIREKADKLKAKAAEFLSRDFGTGVPTAKSDDEPASDLEKRIAQLEAENARLKSFQGVAPVHTPPVGAAQAAYVVVPVGAEPFAEQGS